VKEAHDENSKLKAIAWGAFNTSPLLGTIDAIACAQISVEEKDLGIERDGGGWRFVLAKAGLIQQVFNGVNVSGDRRVTDIERPKGSDAGLLDWYWFSDGVWR